LIQHDDLPASFRSGLHGGDPHEAGARFAAIKNTASFLRIAATEATVEGGREIVMLYRYTCFSRM
jgi:hypothetical protein